MEEQRWQKIEEVFNQAAQLPVAERRRFVEEKCGADADLCEEILRLIEADADDSDFLEQPIFTLGARILDDDFRQLPANGELASYKIKKLLGRGGMGTVFLAEDAKLNRLVALKILPAALTQDSASVTRFQQEARAASNVSHPSVAHIYEFGHFENYYFLAMEYVAGHTLRELIRDKLINRQRAVEIALEIASALQAAHKNGIVHRDIKPENVIVSEDGGAVKVLDFGLAKLNPAHERQKLLAAASSLETVPGLIMGTAAYMSPEQIRGQTVDGRTDLWSLGVCLYEMFWGRRPFEGETPGDVQAAILRDEAVNVLVKDKISREFSVIVNKCLAKNRLERYETASELIEDLRRLQKKINDDRQSRFLNSEWKTRDWIFKALLPLILVSALMTATMTSIPTIRKSLFQAGVSPPTAETRATKDSLEIKSLAILPFRIAESANLKDAEKQQLDFLSLGLAEDLTRSLGSVNAVKVKSFSAARKMREITRTYKIKEQLQTDAILRGVIEKSGDRIWVLLELVRTNDDSILWKDDFDAASNNWLRLRNALATLIANNLQSRLNSERKLILPDYQTNSEAAFRVYLAGKYSPARTTAAGLRQTIPDLRKAVRLDPDYALAYVALADTYNLLGSWYGERPHFYLPLAKKNLERALQLDPNLSEAHTSLAKIKMDYDRDFAGAEQSFRRAVELNPNNAQARHWYGEVYLSAMVRLEESVRELETASELDPTAGNILTGLAWTLIGMKDYENAIRECDRALALNPRDAGAHSYKAMALMKLKRFKEAIAAARESEANEGSTVDLGVIYALAGQPAEAQEILQKLELKKQTGDVSDYDLAVIYAALGERDRAFALLEREAESKSVDLLSIRVDPLLDTLRDDARFVALEAKLNLPK